MADPSQEPNVPATTTPQKLMDAPSWVDRMAAGGMTTSLGTGKMELSMAIRTMTPAYPQSCTQDIQSEINSCITARILH